MKKILSILLTLTVLVTTVVPIFAAENDTIKVFVNGTEVQFPYQKPIIQDGLLLVPIEDIFEALEFQGTYTEYEGQEGGIGGFGETIPDTLPHKRLEFNKNENNREISIYFEDINEYTGEPTTRFGAWSMSERFDLTKPLQFMNGRGMLVLDDICKATNAQLNWDKENNIANITYNGTYFKTNHVITEEEKIKYGIYVPSLDTYLYIGMPKEDVEKLLGKSNGKPTVKGDGKTYYYCGYKDKNGENLTIEYNPIGTQVISLHISSKGAEKFGHKVGDPMSFDYSLKENEYWLSFGMYSETYLAIDDKEDTKCDYQFLNDGKYYFDTNGERQYKPPTKITSIFMTAYNDLINELGIDMATK